MGKWATQRRAGSAPFHGYLAPPVVADWNISNITPTTFDINRVSAIPAGATAWGWLVVQVNTGGIPATGSQSATPKTISGLFSTTYNVQIAWFNGTQRVSSWGNTVQLVPS